MTVDTNIAFYALEHDGDKAAVAKALLPSARFLSVQVLNEYAHAARRKLRRAWTDIAVDLQLLRNVVAEIRGIDEASHHDALRIASRYELSFFDAQMLAVALAGGATTIYSEDMHRGLVIDGSLTIVNPFLTAEFA